MVLSQVLEANGIDPAFVLSNAEAEPSEEAFSGSEDEEEQGEDEGEEAEVASVASSAGDDAVPGETVRRHQRETVHSCHVHCMTASVCSDVLHCCMWIAGCVLNFCI